MRKQVAMFANFICKFGDQNLIDYLDTIVMPAFTHDTRVRSAGESSYYFLDIDVTNLGTRENPNFVIAGRFVKDTMLRREQVFDERAGVLKQDERSLASSPSAFFVLVLAEHRLIYMGETAMAPSIAAFATTVRAFLFQTWNEHIARTLEFEESNNGPTNRKAIIEVNPKPRLEIVPVAARESVEQFIRRYKQLTSIEIVVHERNDELDGAELMEAINHHNEKLNGKSTKLVTSGGKDGLDLDEAAKTVSEITFGGNQTVKTRGTDEHGYKLVGQNEEFAVTTEIPELPITVKDRAKLLFHKFKELVAEGVIAGGNASLELRQRVSRLVSRPNPNEV